MEIVVSAWRIPPFQNRRETHVKLNVKAFALSVGILWAIGVFFMTWWLILLEGASDDKVILGRFYLGYHVSPIGSLIGLAWALPDGVIGGAIFAWLYNRLASPGTGDAGE